VGRLPAVRLVAVVGRFDARWGERPVLVVELHAGESCGTETLLGCLRGKVASWWIPDSVVHVESMPLAATGKIDKNRLRTIMEMAGSPVGAGPD
jgi:fatty-acyl-CoA synthase